MATIGEVHQIRGEFEFEWKIENVSSIFNKENYVYYSVPFYFADASWKIKLNPFFNKSKIEFISFALLRLSFGLPVKLEYSVTVKDVSWPDDYCDIFEENNAPISKTIIRKSQLLSLQSILSSDTLTLSFQLKNTQLNDLTSSRFNRLLDLSESFKQLFAEKRGADLNLNVKGEKFLVHRMMLEARSTLADRNLMEKKTEEMNIGDIDPSSMGAILDYMYAGDTNQLTKENVFFVYAAADKYKMENLKGICSIYIQENLSVEWVCEVLKFAVERHVEDIDRYATRFFTENAAKIVETDHWETFFKEHHDKAVGLLLAKVKKTAS